MIVSASRRTDIPAFYFDWFCQRLQDGYADVVNPFNRKQVTSWRRSSRNILLLQMAMALTLA